MVRFRMNEKGVRPSKPGDLVLDRRGRVIGTVTSCASDGEGYLVGLALVEQAAGIEEGSAIYTVALPKSMPELLRAFSPPGIRLLMPDAATVPARLPMRKG